MVNSDKHDIYVKIQAISPLITGQRSLIIAFMNVLIEDLLDATTALLVFSNQCQLSSCCVLM